MKTITQEDLVKKRSASIANRKIEKHGHTYLGNFYCQEPGCEWYAVVNLSRSADNIVELEVDQRLIGHLHYVHGIEVDLGK